LKRALEAERPKNQYEEFSSVRLPKQSTSSKTGPDSGDRIVNEASSLSVPDQQISPETAYASGEQAVDLIETLYQSLSNQNWSEAADLYGPSLKSQFSPDFFRQFDQVTAENLKITSQSNSEINLVGETIYLYPDETTQRELRSFTVTWNAGIPLITDSVFVRVIKIRS
jgi:hypothetical protein